MKKVFKKQLFHSGTLLVGGAIIAKFFGLLRDRIFVEYFSADGSIDLIFSAFRIPDFFYFLLIGGTVSSIFIPRIGDLKNEDERIKFFSSFFWLVFCFFGIVCFFGMIFPETLVSLFSGGFDTESQEKISKLAPLLFGSVFFLSLSSVFASFLQGKEKFISLAIAPIFYTASICAGTWWLHSKYGIQSVGIAAIGGSLLYLLINIVESIRHKAVLEIHWKKPISAWKGISQDFFRRITNTAAFQINQSVDVLIASFLVMGSVSAFSIGTNLGQVLLSIVAFPIGNIVFSKLSKNKKNFSLQKKYISDGIRIILIICIPTAIFGFFFSEKILEILYGLSGPALEMTKTVFQWTILALPATCLCPILSKAFLANNDTKTPLKTTVFSLLVATGLAAYLSLVEFKGENAILGLAIGNFVASFLNANLLFLFYWKQHTKSIKYGNNTKNS